MKRIPQKLEGLGYRMVEIS